MRRQISIVCAALMFASGCGVSVRGPRLSALYDRAAKFYSPERNAVIVIPGILGSRLKDRGSERMVWGAFTRGYANPRTSNGARLIAHPMSKNVMLSELRDGVYSDGALDRARVELLGLPIELNAYIYILRALGIGGYRDELFGEAGTIDYGTDHYTCFQFDYDWRRDNVENARRLHEFILEKRKYVQGKIEQHFGIPDHEVKFDIVAHSMGGLITRYFLRYGNADLPSDGSAPKITWEGARHVERAVLIGTPNAGSAAALIQLVRGMRLAPFLPKYEAALLGTMPSIYQLLLRGRHGALLHADDHTAREDDIYSFDLWVRMGWGLASPEQDRVLRRLLPGVSDSARRREIALDHLRKCLDRARQFAAALDEPAQSPSGLSFHLFAGDAVATNAVLAVNTGSGRLTVIGQRSGDGTVLRSSALMDERIGGHWVPKLVSPIHWRDVNFLFTDHLGLTKVPAFTDNVLHLLLEHPR